MTVIDLSNRNTTSKKVPEINSLYCYATRHNAKFTHRHQQGIGYPYMSHGILLRGAEAEIHIYHRTVEIRGVRAGLTMVTKHAKFREVQKWFSEQIKVIEASDELSHKFCHAKPTPQELGIYYAY